MTAKNAKLVIDGIDVELTDEQMKSLGIEIKRPNPCERGTIGQRYWYADLTNIRYRYDQNTPEDIVNYNNGNYYTDENILKQRLLHEQLDRMLWAASVRSGELDNSWDYSNPHYYICYLEKGQNFAVDWNYANKSNNSIYFPTKEDAEIAIRDIIKPFVKEHPDFKW